LSAFLLCAAFFCAARSGVSFPRRQRSGWRGRTAPQKFPLDTCLGTRGAHFTGDGVDRPLVGLIMGSKSDWETMSHAARTLEALGVPYERKVVSAHRTPDLLFDYAASAEGRGLRVIIAGAGGAAHLPGMTAAKTTLPVLGVPVESRALKGMDSLLSIVQMPAGVPVGTLAIGRAGAVNAALLAASIIAHDHPGIRQAVVRFREEQTASVLANPEPAPAE